MKDRVFGVLQRVGRSFMLPIAILPAAGLLLGFGSSFTNQTMIETYGLTAFLGESTILHRLLMVMNAVGSIIFDNLPLIFAVGVAIGMAKKEKEAAALSAVISYFVMHAAIQAMLLLEGTIQSDGTAASTVQNGMLTVSCGIRTLQMGVFGGILVGLGVAALHNRYYKIQLPDAFSFFGGTRFVPIISTVVYMFVGILMYFVWPVIQNGIYALGGLVTGSSYLGTFAFGLIKRALIPFGLHHVFYLPFWQTAVGGTMEVAGQLVEGGQNIFFAQLADSARVLHFSADATRYFSGEFIFMIFGLPGAALAMYQCAKPEKRKAAGGLLFSAALTCMATGITEPLEFSFLFAAPVLFVVQVILAGSAYMVAHMLNIAVGLTFSGGFLDLFLFGILQGNEKTGWLRILPVGVIYFLLYYVLFRVLILKLDLKTPGREADTEETRLYSRADMEEKTGGTLRETGTSRSAEIVRGLGGNGNISDVDCCATRLRCTVQDASLVEEEVLRNTGASGVIRSGNGVQIVYGPKVTLIKADLEEYLENPEQAGAAEHDESEEYDGRPEREEKERVVISSPVDGLAAELSSVPDKAFAGGMMGDGAVVTPTDPFVRAPEDGVVLFLFDTKHAIAFQTDTGISLLIHIGIETVRLKGVGFEAMVKKGQKVKKGDPLLKLNLEYLEQNALSMMSPVLCTGLAANQTIRLLKTGEIKAGEPLFVIETKK